MLEEIHRLGLQGAALISLFIPASPVSFSSTKATKAELSLLEHYTRKGVEVPHGEISLLDSRHISDQAIKPHGLVSSKVIRRAPARAEQRSTAPHQGVDV